MTTEAHELLLAEAPRTGIFDLVLADQPALDELLLNDDDLVGVIERLVAVAAIGLVVAGVAVGLATQVLPATPYGISGALQVGHPVLWMPLTALAAFLGALSICLPSFYFYTQLSGIDASFRLVTAQALRAQATTSVLLLAAVPIFLAVALSNVALGLVTSDLVLWFGLLLPFVTGLFGIGAVYRSFGRLVARLPRTHQRRGNFLRRLVVCWGAVYTVVAPVALLRIGQALSGVL